MIYRKATFYEIPELIRLSELLSHELSMGYVIDNSFMSQQMVHHVYQNGGYHIIVHNKQELIGWILIGMDQNMYKKETIGFIYELYVFPAYRKQGIGKTLIRLAIVNFKNAGLNKVQLNVFTGNQAKNLYEKIGFKEVTSLMELPI